MSFFQKRKKPKSTFPKKEKFDLKEDIYEKFNQNQQ
nr:MAG TPA: hypothetical protein [Caudoviricetes sp.]